jgi:hypothetical protein
METKRQPAESLYLSMVIPCTRPGMSSLTCAEQVAAVLEPRMPKQYEIIVLATDTETADLVANPPIKVVPIPEHCESAFGHGWAVADGNVLGVIDGALTDQPSHIDQLLHELEQGSDFVLASRFLDGGDDAKAVGCFAITRERIQNSRFNSKAYQLLIEALGPERVREICRYQQQNSQTPAWRNYFAEIQSLFGITVK